MPLYEAASYRTRHHLSKEQRAEAHRALFGFARHMDVHLTLEEIERMRELVRSHDHARQAETQEFDLNDPPQKPYVYEEFPRLVYHHEQRMHRAVRNEKELAEALKAGFRREPSPCEHSELEEENVAGLPLVEAQARRKK